MSEHRHIVDSAAQSLDALSRHVDGLKEEHARLLRELSKYQAIDTEEGREFMKEPWCILPKSKDEWWVTIPKWTGIHVGWLERSTDTYNVFTVNRYSRGIECQEEQW